MFYVLISRHYGDWRRFRIHQTIIYCSFSHNFICYSLPERQYIESNILMRSLSKTNKPCSRNSFSATQSIKVYRYYRHKLGWRLALKRKPRLWEVCREQWQHHNNVHTVLSSLISSGNSPRYMFLTHVIWTRGGRDICKIWPCSQFGNKCAVINGSRANGYNNIRVCWCSLGPVTIH